ncbi:MAG: aminotransferase class V-fold PLP-dependent enzyme [Anaerolineales bacterium]|jgi:cysteine desulfurase/selenocysteine lyase
MNFFPQNNYANLFTGVDVAVPLLDGTHKQYINFDNAASTPTLKAVQQAINSFMSYYSSVHRGTGFKSQLSTHFYEAARHSVLRFVGADPDVYTCIFGKNTTEAINKLAHRFPFTPERDTVLTSGMEHHSNDLPWRAVAKTIHVTLTGEGRLDEADFETKLEAYADRIALVAITGASNVTGFLNPIHRLAEKAHAIGAPILVDCAQLAPHRKVDMGPLEDPGHLDYVALSAHKMYAPFGTGALVGRKRIFERGDPDLTGGGTVEIVTLDDVVWAEPPEREEAGSPNTTGAIALAAAIHQMDSIGIEAVAQHEADLTAYALEQLQQVPNLEIYGDKDPESAEERLGVIPMQLKDRSHFLTAAILGYEFGIGVRSGCFCAHPYILHLLHLTNEQAQSVRNRMIKGDKSDMPGLVRASFGLYNTREEIDAFVAALKRIAQGEYKGKYHQDSASGEYYPENWAPDFEKYFSFADSC